MSNEKYTSNVFEDIISNGRQNNNMIDNNMFWNNVTRNSQQQVNSQVNVNSSRAANNSYVRTVEQQNSPNRIPPNNSNGRISQQQSAPNRRPANNSNGRMSQQQNSPNRRPTTSNEKRSQSQTSGKRPKNVNVREENLKKHKKSKLILKKTVAVIVALTIIGTTIWSALDKKGKIQLPEKFISTGISVEPDQKMDDFDSDFALLKLNNWKKGISEESLANISFCEENNIPFGIVVESDATSDKQAKADAACVDAILDGKDLSCPIYYDIREISENLSNEEVVEIAESFTDELSKDYSVGICVEENYLIQNDNFGCQKMVVCNDESIDYQGEYDMCYFSETEQAYSTQKYDKTIAYTNERGEDNIKGIDVSEFQGDIDWTKIKEQDVNFAIIRFSSFPGYHDGDSLYIDEKFYENVAACQALDISYGVYCFSTATTVAEAKLEAKKTVEALKRNGLDPGLPIYYDAETDFHKNNPEETAKLAKAFSEEVKENGYRAGLYASYSLIKDMAYYDDSIKDMDKWVAWYRYNSERAYDEVTEDHIPDVSEIGKYNAVQVTENARIDGITVNTVDVNFANATIGKTR